MGQDKILSWLREQRKKGDSWYSIRDIYNGLELTNFDTKKRRLYVCCYQLNLYGYIQMKGQGLKDHIKLFRAYKSKI